jgi:peptide/nickel transport system substrate-binding protein
MSFATPQKAAWVHDAGDQLRRRVLGTGPWVLVSWDEGQRLEFAKNPRYWDPTRPLLDRQIVLENIPRDTAFLMFEAGDLDVVDRLPAPVYTWIQTRDDWRPYIHASSALNVYGERMNVTRKPFDDVRVRRAMNYALNKDHVVRLLSGGATPSHGLLPPGLFGRDAALAPYPYDPVKARALLAEAGYPDGFDIEYVTLKDDDSEKLAASLQADLARVGVRVKVTLMSFATYLSAVGRPDGPSFSYSAWFADFPDPSNFIDTRFHSRQIAKENSNNDSFYANPALDRMIDAARLEGDQSKRAAMYQAIERILYDDAPWIWSYHRKFVEVTQPYVRGYQPHPVWVRAYDDTWLDLGPDGERLAKEAP